MIYLGIGGSVIGFLLCFFVLKHVEATRVALITLVTPVSALLLGRYLNNEALRAGGSARRRSSPGCWCFSTADGGFSGGAG